MKAKSLLDLLVLKLKALYDVEQQLVKALPKMAVAAKNQHLKRAFRDHLQETRDHLKRLEDAFAQLGETPRKTKVEAIRGMVADSEWVIKNIEDRELLDAVLIPSAQYVEHYEMSGYLGAIAMARHLKEERIVRLLEQNLHEEMVADEKLRKLGSLEVLPKISC